MCQLHTASTHSRRAAPPRLLATERQHCANLHPVVHWRRQPARHGGVCVGVVGPRCSRGHLRRVVQHAAAGSRRQLHWAHRQAAAAARLHAVKLGGLSVPSAAHQHDGCNDGRHQCQDADASHDCPNQGAAGAAAASAACTSATVGWGRGCARGASDKVCRSASSVGLGVDGGRRGQAWSRGSLRGGRAGNSSRGLQARRCKAQGTAIVRQALARITASPWPRPRHKFWLPGRLATIIMEEALATIINHAKELAGAQPLTLVLAPAQREPGNAALAVAPLALVSIACCSNSSAKVPGQWTSEGRPLLPHIRQHRRPCRGCMRSCAPCSLQHLARQHGRCSQDAGLGQASRQSSPAALTKADAGALGGVVVGVGLLERPVGVVDSSAVGVRHNLCIRDLGAQPGADVHRSCGTQTARAKWGRAGCSRVWCGRRSLGQQNVWPDCCRMERSGKRSLQPWVMH
jgi:hypothetical protein